MKQFLFAALMCVSMVALGEEPKTPDSAATKTSPPGKESAAPAKPFDLVKSGPWARKPTDEKKLKKELEAFFKEEEDISMKGDQEAMLARIDFPVFMVTDNLKGATEAKSYTREQYIATMKPFYENMPKDVKYVHKPAFTVLSNSIANVTDEFTMTTGKQKLTGRNQSLLIRVDGKWKWKVMAEAGWGEADEQATR